jgi:hypothetical protein
MLDFSSLEVFLQLVYLEIKKQVLIMYYGLYYSTLYMLSLFETYHNLKLKIMWLQECMGNKLFLITVVACFLICSLCLFFFSNFIIKNWKALIRNISKKLENFLNLRVIIQISWFFCIFVILLIFNILGLIPKIVGVTIILFIPVFLAFWIFWVVNFFGFTARLDGFLKKYYPTKLPHLISPGIIWIEFVSYMIRPIRKKKSLFANMLAGHI